MDSEKVKEIKEALKQNDDNGILYEVDYKKRTCKFIHHKAILSLINELESENERLIESCKNCHYIKDLEIANEHAKELKDRIAELEESIEKWQRKAINYYQMAKSYGVECIIDEDIDETLKEFINE